MGSKLTYTVKGPIASFRSADKAPIESLKLHFLPQQEGSGDPSPQNIRNIVGWTGCNGRRSGKNLLPNNIVSGTEHSQGLIFVQNADGSIRITGKGNNTVTKLAVIKNFTNGSFPLKAGIYRPHIWSTDTTKSQIYISIMYNDGDNSMYCNANGTSYSYTISEDVYVNQIRIGLQPSENVEFDLTIYPSLEKGSTPTSWEPCQSEHIPLSWSSHGVEYGGYVDPVRGKLVAEWATYTFTGTETDLRQNYRASGGTRLLLLFAHAGIQYGENGGVISNILRTTNNAHGDNVCYPRPSSQGCIIDLGRSTICNLTEEEFDALTNDEQVALGKAYIANLYSNGTPLIIAYKLVDPIEYNIDPISLQTFLDYNNFWTDMNDDTEVEYAFADRLSERKILMQPERRLVKWNNFVNGYLSSDDWVDRNPDDTTTTFENGVSETTFLGTKRTYFTARCKDQPSVYLSHKYFAYAEYFFDSSFSTIPTSGFEYAGGHYAVTAPVALGDGWYHYRHSVYGGRDGGGYMYMPYLIVNADTVAGQKVKARNVLYIDLTLMFGEGKEPATSDEFLKLCEINGINVHEPHSKDITGTDQWWIIP